MNYIEKTILIERIDQLIRLRGTGSARELAKRVGVSKSTLYEIIEVMKMMGADIEYCRTRRSYYYTTDKVLAIGFVEKLTLMIQMVIRIMMMMMIMVVVDDFE